MTVVVAVKKRGWVAVAADSRTNFGRFQVPPENHQAEKIRKVGASLLASTGWGLYDNILSDFLGRRRRPPLSTEKSIFLFFMEFWRELHGRYPFVNDQCSEKDPSPFGDLDASFLVASRHGIFSVASDMSVTPFEQYYAIGSGSDFAFGALHALWGRNLSAETLARRGVEAAINFDGACGEPIVVRTIRAKT